MKRGQESEVTKEWHQVQNELQRFERSFDAGKTFLEEEASSAITRLHWVEKKRHNNCSNRSCRRPLWAMSKHHCRKCGEIFCGKCVQFQRRLSPNAEYDPNGWLHKVCESCFSTKQQEVGATRSWTSAFRNFWNHSHGQQSAEMSRAVILHNCKNLVTGFQAYHKSGIASPTTPQSATSPVDSAGDTKQKKPFQFLLRGVSRVVKGNVPDWQKPPNWVTEGTHCQCCDRPYGYLESQHNCRICGKLVCKAQSAKELLLYIPDKADRVDQGSEPRWAIIRVIGSPEIEPNQSLHLRVCYPCRDRLREIQVEEQQRLIDEGGSVHHCWQGLVEMHRDILTIQSKIAARIPEFQRLVDSLEIQAGAPASLPRNRNNMQLLAKHQGDLSDHLSMYVITVARLRKLSPQTRMQVKIVRNIITCKFSYYTETNNLYKSLRKKLQEIAPPEILEEIQSMVDEQAINSACLSLKQLAYESLHMCLKYKLNEALALSIKQTEEVCEADLEKKLATSGEEWEAHKKQMENFVRIQIKGDDESGQQPRLYLRPSRRRKKLGGIVYVENFLNQRVMEAISQVHIQLSNRTADRSFRQTKESLGKLRAGLTTRVDADIHK